MPSNAERGSDRKRLIPSEINPTTEELIQARRLVAKGMCKLPESKRGAHYQALLDFLGFFVGTENERKVWEFFFERDSHSAEVTAMVDEEANREGMTYEEYNSRETLKQVRRFCVSQGLPMPASTAGDSAKEKRVTFTDGSKNTSGPGRKQGPFTEQRGKYAHDFKEENPSASFSDICEAYKEEHPKDNQPSPTPRSMRHAYCTYQK